MYDSTMTRRGMDCKIEESVSGDRIFSVTVQRDNLHLLQHEILSNVFEKIASSIATDFVREKGNEIIASIDTKLILNRAVSHAVTGIAKEIDRTSRM